MSEGSQTAMPQTGQGALEQDRETSRRQARLTLLARILESFTGTLDLDAVLDRIVTTTLAELEADRAWILHPVSLTEEFATVSCEATRPGFPGAFQLGVPVPLSGSREIVRKAIETRQVVISQAGDPELDPFLVESFHIRSQMAQLLEPHGSELWGFGVHQCSRARNWTAEEVSLFKDIGRYATIALNNALLHRRAVTEASKVGADERRKIERDIRRRRRAECLANLGLDLFSSYSAPVELDESAESISGALGANVQIYLYHESANVLTLTGSAFLEQSGHAFGEYISSRPYRSGEGIPGTVFEIGKPLLFSEIRGNDIAEFARDEEEKQIKALLGEQTLIASPIDSYGDRIGVIVISAPGAATPFNAEDLEFAQSVASRIGAAVHIHRLNRVSQEGQRAADELARREVGARSNLEAVLDSAPFGIAVVSADELRFELTNPPWLEYAANFGRLSADSSCIGLRVAEVLPGLDRVLRQAAESGETRVDEAVEIRRGLETWYFRQIISPVRGRYSGATQSLTVLVQDVTEQVRAKREIEALAQIMEERSARLASILGSMTDALLVYDSAGRVVDVNPAALSMFGIGSRAEAITRGSLEDLQLRYGDGKAIPSDELPYARALRGEVVPDFLAIGKHLITGRDLDLSLAVAPIESNGIVGAVLVIRDITALQELDRKKDEFLSVASHELRTPLTTIKGYTQLLAQTAGSLGPDERLTYLNAVLGEVNRMMGLITELLDVSRIETRKLQIEPQPIPWIDFIQRRIRAFEVQHPDRQIAFMTNSENVTLEVDADRMRQVVDNLISNAMKYSADGSPVCVAVQVEDGHVETSVTDRGIGIPGDEIPRLFERFHRARNVSSRYYGGLGLGLYIAKAIIEAHSGSISVESSEGVGSTFTIRLPAR